MNIAGIVIYNPDYDRLKKNIEAVVPQVDKLIISCNSIFDKSKISLNNKIEIIDNHGNKGIAYALNKIMERAMHYKAKWCLLLDQDSIIDSKMVMSLNNYTNLESVAMLVPSVVDYRDEYRNDDFEDIRSVRVGITSGSYVNTAIWYNVGKFREDFFIDYVDWEYCARLVTRGYKIYEIGSIKLDHQLGNISFKKCLWFHVQTYNHNAFRKFYITRNSFLVHYLYPNYPEFKHPMLRTIKRACIVLYSESDKMSKIKNIIEGYKDYRKAKDAE